MTWLEAKAKQGCQCRYSDSWRCAVDRQLRTIACACPCHRYITAATMSLPAYSVRGRLAVSMFPRQGKELKPLAGYSQTFPCDEFRWVTVGEDAFRVKTYAVGAHGTLTKGLLTRLAHNHKVSSPKVYRPKAYSGDWPCVCSAVRGPLERKPKPPVTKGEFECRHSPRSLHG